MPLFRDALFDKLITKCLLSQGQCGFAGSGFDRDESDERRWKHNNHIVSEETGYLECYRLLSAIHSKWEKALQESHSLKLCLDSEVEKEVTGTSLVVQWLGLRLPLQEVQVRSLVGELGSHMPRGQKNNIKNRSNIVTSSVKTLKMVHIKKKKSKKKKKKKKWHK